MQAALLVLPVVAPILFWAVYHYHKDRRLPEPLAHLAAAFVLGMLAAGLSQLMYTALGPLGLRYDAAALADSNWKGLLAYALFAIGPIEETAKALPFVIVVLRFREFDDALDGFIYASFIGLGYAAVENWQYLDYLTPIEAVGRGIASPVVHILFASVWGYWIGRAHLAGRPLLLAACGGIAAAALLHGLYDFIVLLWPANALPFAAVVIAALWLWRLKLMRDLHEANGPVPSGGRTDS